MKKGLENELFDLIDMDDVAQIKKKLERNRLSYKWLIHRLNRDFGIKVKPAFLSQVMEGRKALGPKTRRMIWCCLRVVEEYESFYKGR